MKPLSSVVAHIYVCVRNILPRLAAPFVKFKRYRSFVIATHILGLWIFAAFTITVNATTIVAMVDATGVFVAADGLSTSGTLRDGKRLHQESCKVVVYGNTLFATAGISQAPAIGFDSRIIAKQAMATGGGVENVSRVFQSLMEPRFPLLLGVLKSNPVEYSRYTGDSVISTYFGSIDPVPTIVENKFPFDRNGPLPPVIRVFSAARNLKILTLGSNSEIRSFLSSHRYWGDTFKASPPYFRARFDPVGN